MAVAELVNMEGEKVREIEISDEIFCVEVKAHLIHEVVRWQLAKKRRGTACTKTRAEVSGGGRKPWRQKGTGRARQGSIRSPLWVGGGVVFGPKSRDYTYRLPKKVRRQALRSALSLKYGESRLKVLENIEFMRISTKAFHEFMKRLNLQKPLFVVEKKDEILEKSARNIPYTKVLRVEGINVYDVMRYDEIVFTLPALRNLEGTLS